MLLPSLLGNKRLCLALSKHSKADFPSPVIICGDYGTGKKTAAVDMAMGLLCFAQNAPCGVCPSCLRVRAGSHPDFELFNPDGGDIKVDDIRDLRRRTFTRPSEADFKVIIINRADKMNVQGQNALLKVLEESQTTFFIMLCESPRSLLPTVLSRCMVYSLCGLDDNTIIAQLRLRFPQKTKTVLENAAALCDGSLGQAADIISAPDNKVQTLALRFADSLSLGELKIMECSMELSALTRDDYGKFCDSTCRLLLPRIQNGGAPALLDIYEYLAEQKNKLVFNPSVLALSGALAAFCGQCRL